MNSRMKQFQNAEKEKKDEPRGTKELAKAEGFAGMDSSSKAEGRLDEFVPEELLGKKGKKGGLLQAAAAAAAAAVVEEEEEEESESEEESEEEEEVVDEKDVWLTKMTTAFRKRSKQVELAFIDAASTQYDLGAQKAKDDAPYVIAATFEAKPSECICSHCVCFTALLSIMALVLSFDCRCSKMAHSLPHR